MRTLDAIKKALVSLPEHPEPDQATIEEAATLLRMANDRDSGDAKIYKCSKCGHDQYRLAVQFDYWDACDDLLEDESELPVQDYFCNAIFAGACVNCGCANRILDMDL